MFTSADQRVVLDNNIWSYLAAEDTFADLDRLLKLHNVVLITPPSVL